MSNPFNGPASRLWFRWKSLRLPWRKQRLAGWDLKGNTFWEFKDTVRANRWRRIACQPRHLDYADIAISPQWHQWLRHTRPDAPSLLEQQADVQRQIQLKELAQLADQRWQSKQSYLQQPATMTATTTTARVREGESRGDREAMAEGGDGHRAPEETPTSSDDPWEKQREVRENWHGGGEWKPQEWKPRGRG